MDQTFPAGKALVPHETRALAVAIPARNEAALIKHCLTALDLAAAGISRSQITILILVNNSTDNTAEIARAFVPARTAIRVEEVQLSKAHAHAGGARKLAMDKAAQIAGPNGIIMTSDADSEVSLDWIAANLSELNQGVDAVAGTIAFKPADRLRLMPMLLARKDEWHLANLQAQLMTFFDPLKHDPWPNHLWEWGASLAVTVKAYTGVGGMPPVQLAEDRAFAQLLTRHDYKLRHSHLPVVFTSGRFDGRAARGFADLLHDYCTAPDTPCDAAIEPTRDLIQRMITRRSLRQQHASDMGFGEVWQNHQTGSAHLKRNRLYPKQLPAEINYAQAMLSRFQKVAVRPADNWVGRTGQELRQDELLL